MHRPECSALGCSNLAYRKGRYSDGREKYANECVTHYRCKYKIKGQRRARLKKKLGGDTCSICGWDKGTCDLHRLTFGCNGGRYEYGNNVVLCPNCHRLIHDGLLKI